MKLRKLKKKILAFSLTILVGIGMFNPLLISAAGEPTPSISPAYAILYDDGEIVFQRGDTPEEGRVVVGSWTGFETDNDVGWDDYLDKIKTVTFKDTIQPKLTTYWFSNCSNLSSVNFNNNLDTSKVTDMVGMFKNCSSLTSLDVSCFNTSSVCYMGNMFKNCSSLISLDLSSFDTSKVMDITSAFENCSSLISLNTSNMNLTNALEVQRLFYNCNKLTNLDLSNFNIVNSPSYYSMFENCSSLTSLDLSGFNPNAWGLLDLSSMFKNCNKLTKIDLSGFTRFRNATSMFEGCNSLTSLNCPTLTTGDGGGMGYMFKDCKSLTKLDLSAFNGKVSTMVSMFDGCSNLKTIDISNIDTTNITNVGSIFYGCNSLQELKTQKAGRPDIALPVAMIEKNSSDGKVYTMMPSNSKILTPFELEDLESATETMVSFKKTVNGQSSGLPSFNFGVYKEDGTQVEIVQNDSSGNISVETQDYEPGRYYVQEITGANSGMQYDGTKYYFTIEVETRDIVGTLISATEGTSNTVEVLSQVDSSLLTDYTLIANGYNVTAMDSTGQSVATFHGYCANHARGRTTGILNKVYIDPTVSEINEARGEVYSGSQPNISDAIKCILYYERNQAQTRIWDLFNHSKTIDVSKVGDIPADFHYAIITPPNWKQQPLIVPLTTSRIFTDVTPGSPIEEQIKTGTIQTRIIKLETPNATFNNKIKDATDLVEIKKWDTTNDKALAGAHLQVLYDDNGTEKVFDEWDSAVSSHVMSGLIAGTEYTLRETSAPNGYSKATDTKFTLKADGSIDKDKTTTPMNEKGVLLVNDKVISVDILKMDATNNVPLPGAHIQVTYEKTDQGGGVITPGGNDGDEGGGDDVFVGDDGDEGFGDGGGSFMGGLPEEDLFSLREISTQDAGEPSAQDDSTQEILAEWDSTSDPHSLTGLTPGVEYTIHETSAPDGYLIATDTKFVVKEDGTIDMDKTTTPINDDGVLLVNDEAISVDISKMDITNNKELAGAHLQVLTKDGDVETVFTEWNSTDTAKTISKLIPGTEYILRETVAPDGYIKTSDTKFVLKADGSIDKDKTTSIVKDGKILVDNTLTSVNISKMDITNNKELAGAHLQVLYKDGDTNKFFTEWDSTTSAKTITGLIPGVEYTLRETLAPDGYSKATDTKFTLKADGSIDKDKTSTPMDEDDTLLVNDKQFGKLTVSKNVSGSMGDKSKDFNFELHLSGDDAPKSIPYTKGTETGTITITDGVGKFTLAHDENIVFDDIVIGVNYEVVETDAETNGYTVTPTNAKGTVSASTVVSFTNNREGTVPTAANTNTSTFIATLVASLLIMFAMIGFFIKRRKTN